MTNHWQTYQDLKAQRTEKSPFFPREAAQHMGISECELVLAHPQAVYLGTDIKPVVLKLQYLGLVESIVRNDLAVHEKQGIYENVSMTPAMGIALNVGGLDLRIFAKKWRHALALTDETAEKTTRSIQFYDEYGVAIDKVFMREINDSTLAAWQSILDEFSSLEVPTFTASTAKETWTYKPLSAEKVAGFHERWLELKDIHHFHGILETYELDRLSSYRQAPENMAFRTVANAFEMVFEQVKAAGFKLMTFVGSSGLVQIQTGQVHNIKRMHGWLNLLDKKEEQFCLHLKDTELAQIWVVKRPTRDGIVSCVEGFDQYGKTIITLFGFRQEGSPELEAWQHLVANLPVFKES